MADCFGKRRKFPVVFALAIWFVFALDLTMSSSVAAEIRNSSTYRSGAKSAFVRRSLEERQSGLTLASRSSYSYLTMSSAGSSVSSRVRRLAGSANCTSNPNICADATTYGANATCCASTGACSQLQSDTNNCGFCRYACASTLGCCNGLCTSILTDNQNCGSCGTVCRNSLCTSGMCGYGG